MNKHSLHRLFCSGNLGLW